MFGWIYFIRCPLNNLIKIGHTKDHPSKRFQSITGMSPVPLEKIAVMRADKDDEGRHHAMFHEFRRHGEWFEGVDPLTNYIAEASIEWPEGKKSARNTVTGRLKNYELFKAWAASMVGDKENPEDGIGDRSDSGGSKWSRWRQETILKHEAKIEELNKEMAGLKTKVDRLQKCLSSIGVPDSWMDRLTPVDVQEIRKEYCRRYDDVNEKIIRKNERHLAWKDFQKLAEEKKKEQERSECQV